LAVTAMNHFTVLTDDLARTLTFYVGLLGLREGPRPPLAFPGAWLYVGEQAVLHVVAGRPLPTERRGVLDHIAFSATELLDVIDRLDAADRPYDLSRQPGSGVWQLFIFDPNGARVELDFPAEEVGPG
jgi:catechol 2,3-dioxygenase-like lactoylglutathione lyase family enzyme